MAPLLLLVVVLMVLPTAVVFALVLVLVLVPMVATADNVGCELSLLLLVDPPPTNFGVVTAAATNGMDNACL